MPNNLDEGATAEFPLMASPDPTLTPFGSPDLNMKRHSQLETFQILVGNVDAPPSPRSARDLYHEILADEHRARHTYYGTGFLFFLFVLLQIIFCLSIAVGAQLGVHRTTISILAAINTVVAAVIGVLKGLGLPEKKGIERTKLQRVIKKIKYTTNKLKLGIELDANKEADDVRNYFDDTEEAAQITMTDLGAGMGSGGTAVKR